MGLANPDKSLYISTIVGLKPPSLQTSFSPCFSFFSVGMLPGKIQLTCRAPLFDWLVREQWARRSDVSSDLCPSDDDLFFDPMEELILKEVVDLIARSLREAKDSDCALRCTKLLIPEKLLEHIGQELLHLAASEPCGLRGALIDLCVEQGTTYESIAQLSVDPYLVPTFQLTLVLRLESGGLWPKIQGLFSSKSPSTPVLRQAVKLSTGFRVIKKKLYSSEGLLIEEC
ncbi:DNA damage-inducible transcript 4 protein [Xenoophorus captivus]|uniref:DNA damage-inducible transcript 4 protein n=1 Tax=Xenoophorus captivus TaxID=1517983 RepID=A0ABV0RMJ9_9TELE